MATGVDYVIDRIQEQIRITDKLATKICFLENVEHRHRFNQRCIIHCASNIRQHYTRSNVNANNGTNDLVSIRFERYTA